MEFCKAATKLFHNSQELGHLAAVPFVCDHLRQPIPADLPHDDKVKQLNTAWTNATEDFEGKGKDGILDHSWMFTIYFQKILCFGEDIVVNTVTPHQFQNKFLFTTPLWIAEEPNALIEATTEALHFFD